jgi:hypothetical protein
MVCVFLAIWKHYWFTIWIKEMSDLSIDDLKAKIKTVKGDIESLRLTGDSSRKLEVLTEYLGYLEDELKMEENEYRLRNRT